MCLGSLRKQNEIFYWLDVRLSVYINGPRLLSLYEVRNKRLTNLLPAFCRSYCLYARVHGLMAYWGPTLSAFRWGGFTVLANQQPLKLRAEYNLWSLFPPPF